MVDGLFSFATLTGHRGGHTPFVQAGAETSDTGAEAVKPDTGSTWEGHSEGVDAGVGDESTDSCRVMRSGVRGGGASAPPKILICRTFGENPLHSGQNP